VSGPNKLPRHFRTLAELKRVSAARISVNRAMDVAFWARVSARQLAISKLRIQRLGSNSPETRFDSVLPSETNHDFCLALAASTASFLIPITAYMLGEALSAACNSWPPIRSCSGGDADALPTFASLATRPWWCLTDLCVAYSAAAASPLRAVYQRRSCSDHGGRLQLAPPPRPPDECVDDDGWRLS
jgi:hypothetical protein